VQAVADSGVGETDFAFHARNLAFAAHESFHKIKLFAGELVERSACEATLYSCIAITAVKTSNGDVATA
jgi:hypothetical protein